jgi:GSH-dependent disulfide-bond oxidoreductase
MIDLYALTSPNVQKIFVALEELELPYNVHAVDVWRGEQYKAEFQKLNPNGRIPVIVDHEGPGGKPYTVFESGAILLYLAEKTGRFLPPDPLGRKEATEWLFWQVGNQGPAGGQLSHFVNYAPAGQDYARQRYADEYDRCLGVLERRLEGRDYILGAYSIADMICWPWVLIAKPLGQSLDASPKVAAWRQRVKERPAVQAGVDLGKELRRKGPPSEAERKMLFNQTARSVER